jgi:AcrR family transcriptional regulator
VNANSHPVAASLPLTARQAEILDRTAELVAEAGLANLTMKRVAERVGFTEPAIYRHFTGKRELVLGLVDRLGERLLGTLRAIAADASRPPRERLLDMVRHHVRVLRATRGLPILLLAEGLASGDEELVARMGGVMRPYLGLLAGLLAELELPVGLAPERQASLFIGLPAALGMQLRAFPDLALDDAEVDALVGYYVRALTAAVPPGPARPTAPEDLP